MTTQNAPSQTTTGRGASAAEIGADVAAMIRSQTPDFEIFEKWWDLDRIVSIEGCGTTWTGRGALEEKHREWHGANEVLRCTVRGPFVGGSGFSLFFGLEIRDRASGDVIKADEIAVYTVENGKVVREEFMYSHEAG